MRIGQLARRLGIPTSDILGYLGTQNIDAEAGANSRLGQELLVKVVNRFAPEKLSELLQTPAEEPVAEVVPVVEETIQEPVAETPDVETPGVEKSADDETPETPIEVIRVSKVELQGLKVLGKIDLPQPKKKEVSADETTEPVEGPSQQESQPIQQTQQRPRREYPKRNDRNDRRDQREWKNPLEAKRQAEAREAERKKKEQEERQKEKRANHYYSKVKSVPTKAVRRIEEQTVVENLETKETPRGLFGRFFHWLRN